jgi:hypothetical protein
MSESQLNRKDMELLEPLLREKREADQQAILERRKVAAEEIEATVESRNVVLEKIDEEIKVKKELVKEARERLKNLEFEAAKLGAERHQESFRTDNVIKANQRILYETYDSRIDEAQRFFLDKHDELRKVNISEQVRNDGRNLVTLKNKLIVYSNSQAATRAVEYCMSAYRQLEEMKTQPEYNHEEVENLKKNIPDPRVFEAYDGQSSIKEEPADWSLWHLCKKVDAMLAR